MSGAGCSACDGRWPAGAQRIADPGATALLGNVLPDIHRHVVLRAAADPAPKEPAWAIPHDVVRLSPAAPAERIARIRSHLGGAGLRRNRCLGESVGGVGPGEREGGVAPFRATGPALPPDRG